MSGCGTLTDLGVVRDVLTAVECNTRSFAQLGYEALTASSSPFQTALTAALTIYVALVGYRLLFGDGARLSDGPVIALKIGAVLTLVTSWSLFQTLVFDLAQKAPVEIAAVISRPLGSGPEANPVTDLQIAYDQLSQAADRFAHPVPGAAEKIKRDYATAAETLSLAAKALFVSAAGLIAVITIAIGFLTATGPLFIALFLFSETRGFFVGWLRFLAASAFGLISAWSLSILMLRAIAPWVGALSNASITALSGRVGITTAIIVLVFSAAQILLFIAGVMITRSFGVSRARRAPMPATVGDLRCVEPVLQLHMLSRPTRLAEQLAHDAGVSVAPGRIAVAAAGAAHLRRDDDMRFASPQRIGDFYRRPAGTSTRRAS